METTKRLRGRPPKPPGETLSEKFELRLNGIQKEKLEKLGGANWLRDLLDNIEIELQSSV